VTTIVNLPPGKKPEDYQGPTFISPAMDPCVAMGLVQAGVEITLTILKNTQDPDVAAVARGTLVKLLDQITLIHTHHQPLWMVPKDK
jgi:hypothetical protein